MTVNNRHNVITKEAARIIFNKVEASNVPIAIFAANGVYGKRLPILLVGV